MVLLSRFLQQNTHDLRRHHHPGRVLWLPLVDQYPRVIVPGRRTLFTDFTDRRALPFLFHRAGGSARHAQGRLLATELNRRGPKGADEPGEHRVNSCRFGFDRLPFYWPRRRVTLARNKAPDELPFPLYLSVPTLSRLLSRGSTRA